MRNLKELGAFHCEPQSELKIFPLLVLCKAKPTEYRHALEREVVGSERIDVRARAALQRAKVDDGSLFIEKLSQVVDRAAAHGIKRDVKLVSVQRFTNLLFPVAMVR